MKFLDYADARKAALTLIYSDPTIRRVDIRDNGLTAYNTKGR